MVDDLPVGDRPPRPLPRLHTLTLLVGRITTIKLAYWAALTAAEIVVGSMDRPFVERSAISVGVGAVLTAAALAWAGWSARSIDARAGGLERSIPTVATAFVTASAVATPASLPLLLLARSRSVEGCAPAVCHWDAIWLWVAAVAVGTFAIPLAFAVRMRSAPR